MPVSRGERLRKQRVWQKKFSQSPAGKASAVKRRRTASIESNLSASKSKARYRSAGLKTERVRMRDMLAELKSKPCLDCGGTFDPVCMDFDHRPDENKKFAIGAWKSSRKGLLEEIAKCDLVCANCHRIRTHRLRDHRLTRVPRYTPQMSFQIDIKFDGGEA